MNIIDTLFGEGKDLNALQMSCRAVVIFIIAIGLLKIAGQHTFGKHTATDNVVTIILGAVLSRAISGVSPFFPVLASALTIVLLRRLFSWASLRHKKIGHLIKGKHICLYNNGQHNFVNMNKASISEADIMACVRLQTNSNSLNNVQSIYLEAGGEVSVIKKSDE